MNFRLHNRAARWDDPRRFHCGTSARTPDFPAFFSISHLAVRLLAAVVLIAGGVALSLENASAAAAEEVPWDEAAGLNVSRDGAVDPGARIFDSPDYQRQLIVPGEGEDAYVVDLRKQSYAVLPASAVRYEDDLPVPDLSAATPGAGILKDQDEISFFAGDHEWKVQSDPPLVGPITNEQFTKAKPEYFYRAAKYTPDPTAVKALQSVSAETRIVVFFGTWCTYCKKWIPRLIGSLEQAGNDRLKMEYVGVSEDQLEPEDQLKLYHVNATPSVVVMRGGKEIGRIVEHPEVSMEADLARILAQR